MTATTRIELRPEEAIDALVPTIASCPDNVVCVTCVDEKGFVGPSECFRWQDEGRAPELEELFELPLSEHAAAVIVTSKWNGAIGEMHARDRGLTSRLDAAARACGIALFDHVIVEGRASER